MRLLEIAVGEQTLPEVVERIRQFCDVKLGKGVVFTHDTPSFIANRIADLLDTNRNFRSNSVRFKCRGS